MERKSIEIARKNNIWAKWKKKILSEKCGSRRDAENNGQNKDRVWERVREWGNENENEQAKDVARAKSKNKNKNKKMEKYLPRYLQCMPLIDIRIEIRLHYAEIWSEQTMIADLMYWYFTISYYMCCAQATLYPVTHKCIKAIRKSKWKSYTQTYCWHIVHTIEYTHTKYTISISFSFSK